ncbi:MAG: ParB/RepB/Spo0J family partition protein [Proteobacteria bacterium]|uniref:ParB/RepB/Spo0J family partition protein n=1 Tax=Candidatus Enterousia excrementavium TaxID=2840789 RepID=A0A940IBJ9_9PROT|nr:ParB/RepB/Spo0J family partition protein [Candidatus Enterousia excrementavium]
MSKFGMGRGLADIQHEMGNVPDISVLTGAGRVVVKQIPLAQIGANPDQPRKTFTESELADLAASIKERGVLQPILLRSVTGRPYLYEIVAGERRFRASKLAGLSEIPALIKQITPENAMEIALIENVQRENLNPIEESAAYKNIMDKCGYELADVARLIGKSESYIRNIMRLDTLPVDVKEMVERGDISASHARTIAVAENPTALAKKIIDDKLSVADTEKMVRNTARKTTGRAYVPKTIDARTVQEIESKLHSALGVKAKLREKRGGAGQVILEFATRTQMQELVEKLTK